MKLVVIIGPHAVGKMTVGQELAKLTELRLFHNHMTIELVAELFENVPAERSRLTQLFREEIFKAYAASDEYGMIFTFMWAFDSKVDWDYMEHVEKLFTEKGGEVYYVELEADKDVRLERNKTDNRLLNKPSKRNIEKSEKLFTTLEAKYRLNSFEGEIKKTNYMRINNTDLPPETVASMIKERFSL